MVRLLIEQVVQIDVDSMAVNQIELNWNWIELNWIDSQHWHVN